MDVHLRRRCWARHTRAGPVKSTRGRRSIRLLACDYSGPGGYFVTICTHQRECLFEDERIRCIVEAGWQAIPTHFLHTDLDEWVIMPNHIHGILLISRGEAFTANVGIHSSTPLANASPLPRPCGTQRGSLGDVIQNFKSVTTRRIHQARLVLGLPIWQRNYYESSAMTRTSFGFADTSPTIHSPGIWMRRTRNGSRRGEALADSEGLAPRRSRRMLRPYPLTTSAPSVAWQTYTRGSSPVARR
jgi:putative transposase